MLLLLNLHKNLFMYLLIYLRKQIWFGSFFLVCYTCARNISLCLASCQFNSDSEVPHFWTKAESTSIISEAPRALRVLASSQSSQTSLVGPGHNHPSTQQSSSPSYPSLHDLKSRNPAASKPQCLRHRPPFKVGSIVCGICQP